MFRLPLEYYLYRFGQWTAGVIFWLLTCIGVRLPSARPLDMEICKHLCERALGEGRDYPNQGVFAQSALLLFMSILKDEGYFQIPDFDPKQNLSTT